MYSFKLSRSAMIYKCLFSGSRSRGLLFLPLPDVSNASVAGIFREMTPVLLLGVYWELACFQ